LDGVKGEIVMPQHGSVRQSPIIVTNKKPMSKAIKVALWALLIVLIVSTLAIVGISSYVGWSLTHPDQKLIDNDPSQFGLPYEDFEVLSKLDQIRLSGWAIETDHPPKGVIIMAHGYKENRLQHNVPALALSQSLVGHDYHVLLFDFRNSGESEGDLTTVGYHEKEDLISVVHYAKEKYPDLPIGVIGFSMGAVTSITAAEEETAIEAVVADSPFANMREYLTANLSVWSDLPDFPFTPIILTLMPTITGLDIDEVNPREAVKNVHSPMLLIHGDGDTSIPNRNSKEILENSVHPDTALWIPSGSGHVKGYADYPEEYTKRVIQFFDQSLK
jgi:alpha-beta hydrolase superfamily lysophospholipase